jgi:hypothetical protein
MGWGPDGDFPVAKKLKNNEGLHKAISLKQSTKKTDKHNFQKMQIVKV